MKEILEIIESNPKIPPKEIATMTGLTEAEVASNIREWKKMELSANTRPYPG